MSNTIHLRKGWMSGRPGAGPARGLSRSGVPGTAADVRSWRHAATERVIFWLLLAGLAWTPFMLGSNSLQAWGINALLFPLLAMAYELTRIVNRQPHSVSVRAIAVPALLFAAVAGWIVIQSVTVTPRALHSPLWGMAAAALGVAVDGSITLDRDLTVHALLRLMTAASAFWLALQLGRDARRADQLMAGIAIICAGYAVHGLYSFSVAPGGPLNAEPGRGAGFVSSTFYNRNNFATYAGIGAVITAGLLLRLYRRAAEAGGPVRLRLAAFIETTGKGGAIHICTLFVIIAALLLTGSRGGILAALVGAVVLLMLTHAQRRGAVIGASMVVIALVVIVAFAGFGDSVAGRIGQQGFGDESRLAIYRLTLGSILEAPLLGYGHGTFADVFPMIRDRSVDTGGIWLMAHNTYLEAAQGLGLLFGSMLLASIGLLVLRCLLGARKRRMNATIPAIAGSVGCLIAANALIDFSLQIQAVTLTFMAVLGAGTAQSLSSQRALHD